MTKLSRRSLLAGAIVAPAVSLPFEDLRFSLASPGDELSMTAAEWIDADQRLTAMELRWQDFESLLFDKAKKSNLCCSQAQQSDMPEAVAMRQLDVEIEETRRRRETLAEAVSGIRAVTFASAIAKIELGLKVQGPFDWRDHALALLEGGVAELRQLISQSGAIELSSFR